LCRGGAPFVRRDGPLDRGDRAASWPGQIGDSVDAIAAELAAEPDELPTLEPVDDDFAVRDARRRGRWVPQQIATHIEGTLESRVEEEGSGVLARHAGGLGRARPRSREARRHRRCGLHVGARVRPRDEVPDPVDAGPRPRIGHDGDRRRTDRDGRHHEEQPEHRPSVDDAGLA
jgi:hypothetical protein